MRMRGQWREWRLAEGDVSAPALPTLHPAFLLRQPQAKKQAWADMLSLAARLEALESGVGTDPSRKEMRLLTVM
jgi:uracil-DNA glycosylase